MSCSLCCSLRPIMKFFAGIKYCKINSSLIGYTHTFIGTYKLENKNTRSVHEQSLRNTSYTITYILITHENFTVKYNAIVAVNETSRDTKYRNKMRVRSEEKIDQLSNPLSSHRSTKQPNT
jgi:hypothetical protein